MEYHQPAKIEAFIEAYSLQIVLGIAFFALFGVCLIVN